MARGVELEDAGDGEQGAQDADDPVVVGAMGAVDAPALDRGCLALRRLG